MAVETGGIPEEQLTLGLIDEEEEQLVENADQADEAWLQTMEAMQAYAELSNDRVESMVFDVDLEDSGIKNLYFRINGAITTDEGKLQTMVVGVLLGRVTTQEFVVNADWEGDKVTRIKTDRSLVRAGKTLFSESFVALNTLQILTNLLAIKRSGGTIEYVNEVNPVTGLTVPETYAPRVN